MLSSPKSNKLSLYLTDIILFLITAIALFLPKLTSIYIDHMGRPKTVLTVTLVTCYSCYPFAVGVLLALRRLLKNIIKGEIFIQNNITQLNILFFCCLIISVITIVTGFIYMPFLIIGIAAGFFALILRVIKNVFRSAIEIKAENELTI